MHIMEDVVDVHHRGMVLNGIDNNTVSYIAGVQWFPMSQPQYFLRLLQGSIHGEAESKELAAGRIVFGTVENLIAIDGIQVRAPDHLCLFLIMLS